MVCHRSRNRRRAFGHIEPVHATLIAARQASAIRKLPRIPQRSRMAEKKIAFERDDYLGFVEVVLWLKFLSKQRLHCRDFGIAIDRFVLMPFRPGEFFEYAANLPGQRR